MLIDLMSINVTYNYFNVQNEVSKEISQSHFVIVLRVNFNIIFSMMWSDNEHKTFHVPVCIANALPLGNCCSD